MARGSSSHPPSQSQPIEPTKKAPSTPSPPPKLNRSATSPTTSSYSGVRPPSPLEEVLEAREREAVSAPPSAPASHGHRSSASHSSSARSGSPSVSSSNAASRSSSNPASRPPSNPTSRRPSALASELPLAATPNLTSRPPSTTPASAHPSPPPSKPSSSPSAAGSALPFASTSNVASNSNTSRSSSVAGSALPFAPTSNAESKPSSAPPGSTPTSNPPSAAPGSALPSAPASNPASRRPSATGSALPSAPSSNAAASRRLSNPAAESALSSPHGPTSNSASKPTSATGSSPASKAPSATESAASAPASHHSSKPTSNSASRSASATGSALPFAETSIASSKPSSNSNPASKPPSAPGSVRSAPTSGQMSGSASATPSPRITRPPLMSAPSTASPFLDMSQASSATSVSGLTGLTSTPTAPAGLVISKAGLEATAKGDKVVGVLCLKVTLPRDGDGHPQRWGLFSGPKPKLRSIPALYPLPASLALASTSEHISTAAALLALPPPGAYPPVPADSGLIKPYVDVSRATDQVFVVVDSSTPSATPSTRRTSVGARSRSEWLVIIEFEADVEEDNSGGETWYKASIPTPKCLDNFIRFEIVPRDPSSPSAAEIVTMPRVLPLPSSVFDAHDPSTPSKHHFEDGWEDGEVHGATSSEGSDDDDDDDDSSWLHGRYQSTDVMTLQWGFAPALGAPPDLRITPQWDYEHPSINVTFEAVIAAISGPFGLEAILPPGWGWSSLQIRAGGLFSWRSADQHGLGALASATTTSPDDSMDTVDAFSPTLGQSAMMPNLAPLDATDFSFELNSSQEDRPAPTTPSLSRIERHGAAVLKVVPRTPTPASIFELEFEHGDSTDDEDEDVERVLLVEGTLVPLALTLVSPDAPVPVPFFRFDDASLPTTCDVKCAEATLVPRPNPEDDNELLCDTTAPSVGTFEWTDEAGARIAPRKALPVSGNVRVVAKRNIWGLQTVSVMLPWPAWSEEIVLGLGVPAAAVRVIRASTGSKSLPHSVLARVKDGEAFADIRLAQGRGSVEVVLEVADDNGVALPAFSGGMGEMRVELVGDGWEKLLADKLVSNLERTGARTFTGGLAVVPYITFAPPAPPASAPAAETPPTPSPPPVVMPSVKETEADSRPVRAKDEEQDEDDENEKLRPIALGPITETNPSTPIPPSTPVPQVPGTVERSRVRSFLSQLVSWSTLVNLVMLWILGSLAGQVARLRAEVAFVADDARDLRLYGFDREREMREAAERAERVERERVRGAWGWAAAGPDSAITTPPHQQPPPHESSTTDAHGAHTSAPDTAVDAVDADSVDDILEQMKGGRSDVAAIDGREYGLGRVVRGDGWAWLNHPSIRPVTQTLAWIWSTFLWFFAA